MNPKKISDALLVFPAGAQLRALIPPEAFLQRAWADRSLDEYRALFNTTVLLDGGTVMCIQWKPGIDEGLATRHLATIVRTMDVKHEVKETAYAMLMREWTQFIKYRCYRTGIKEIGVQV